jgi:hypothetical protein
VSGNNNNGLNSFLKTSIWRDMLFIAAIGGVIYYAGAAKRQIDINTGRLDTLEHVISGMTILPAQILEVQKNLERHETSTDRMLSELRQSDAEQRRMVQELYRRDDGRSPGR